MTKLYRNEEIIKMVDSGISKSEVARKFRITKSRVAQIYVKAKRAEKLETSEDKYSKLYRFLKNNSRCTTALWRMGIQDIETLKVIYSAGDIIKVRNLGAKSIEHIKKCLEDNKLIEVTKKAKDSEEIEGNIIMGTSMDEEIKEEYTKRKELKDFLNHSLAYRCLIRYGITSVKQLKEVYEKDNELSEILTIRSIGKGTIEHIKRCLGWKPDSDLIPEYLDKIKQYCLTNLQKGKGYEFEGRWINDTAYDVIISYNKCASNHYFNVYVHYYDENDYEHFDLYTFIWYIKYAIHRYDLNGRNIFMDNFKLILTLLDDIKEELIKEQPFNEGKPDMEVCYFCDKKDTMRCKPYNCNPDEII